MGGGYAYWVHLQTSEDSKVAGDGVTKQMTSFLPLVTISSQILKTALMSQGILDGCSDTVSTLQTAKR